MLVKAKKPAVPQTSFICREKGQIITKRTARYRDKGICSYICAVTSGMKLAIGTQTLLGCQVGHFVSSSFVSHVLTENDDNAMPNRKASSGD